MILSDIHTHTAYSHAADSARAMADAAKAAGLRYYGFSEHSPRPVGYAYPEDYQERIIRHYKDYISDVQALKRENTADFTVLLGLEADFIAGEMPFVRQIASAPLLDYVIGGLHFIGPWGFDFDPEDWNRLDTAQKRQAYAAYYRDLGLLCASGTAHIISHPDLIKLFSVQDFNAWVETTAGRSAVREALKTARDHDVIMEISSAGLRKPCREIYPGPRVMELAAELGVKVSVSSDAHAVSHIAYAFDTLEAYARSFGYTGSHIVQGRKQLFLPF